MKAAVPRETFPGERRVALIPASVPPLVKAGMEVLVQSGAGVEAGYSDEQYQEKGAKIVASRDELFAADIMLQVRAAGANPEAGKADLARYRQGQVVIGMSDPLGNPQPAAEIAAKGVSLFRPGIAAPHHPGTEHGRALVAGHDGRLSGRAAGGRAFCPKCFPC